MNAITKETRKMLRQAADEAYTRELNAELEKLRAQFVLWRRGEISPFELSDRIHSFHQGLNRDLYSRYGGSDTTLHVSSAGYRGVMKLDELHPDVAQHVAPMVETLKSLNPEPGIV